MSKQGNGNGNGKMTMTRRDFIKTTAAAGAAGGMLDLAAGVGRSPAVPATGAAVDHSTTTTCPFCSVGCGQIVDVDASENVLDVYGDPNHPVSNGTLCPKGAAGVQLVNGDRRLGTSGSVLPLNSSNNPITGPCYRVGNNAWKSLGWTDAINMVADKLVNARGTYASGGASAKKIAFLGCSHATNEENWVYRKMIGNLGTNNIEHQARI